MLNFASMEKLAGTSKKKKRSDKTAMVFDLKTLLASRNIDILRYEPIGAAFYQQEEDAYIASVVCIDRHKFAAGESYLLKILLEDFTKEEYHLSRKKFEVIINPGYHDYYNLNISKELLQSDLKM